MKYVTELLNMCFGHNRNFGCCDELQLMVDG